MYRSSTGYTARALLGWATAPETNGYADHELQARLKRIITNFRNLLPKNKHTNAPISNGKRQYPKRLRLWKKMILPPSNKTLRVRITAPKESTPKTTANTFDLFSDAEDDKTRARKIMKKNGPHRSQSLKADPKSSRNGFGKTTFRRFEMTRNTSRFNVTRTGSSKVD